MTDTSAATRKKSGVLPGDITSYDLLKAAAVVIMIVDHIGFYFFPEQTWFRAIGRIGFPVWFFLIGHASGRGISDRLWGGALILLLSGLVVGMPLFPLSALVTIILIRLSLDYIMAVARGRGIYLVYTTLVMIVLYFPTGFLTEYGTLAVMFAMMGYMVRRAAEPGMPSQNGMIMFTATCFVVFVVTQAMIFGFPQLQWYVMALGTGLVCLILFGFRLETYPELTRRLPPAATSLIQLMGRRTLEIYVLHLLLFRALALLTEPDRFALLDLKLF